MVRKIFVLVLLVVVCAAGCESMGEKSKKGAVVGGLLGAAAGGIIGHQGGHGWEGALIGGAAGAVAGGLIGNEMDKKQQESNPSYLSLVKIAEMASDGVPDDVIIDEIKKTGSVYVLDAETIDYLKDNGVSDVVIDYMTSTSK